LGNLLKKSRTDRGFDSKKKISTRFQAKEKKIEEEAKLDKAVNTMQK
jgi:guanylate kinase